MKTMMIIVILMRIILAAAFEAQQRAQTDQQLQIMMTNEDNQNAPANHYSINKNKSTNTILAKSTDRLATTYYDGEDNQKTPANDYIINTNTNTNTNANTILAKSSDTLATTEYDEDNQNIPATNRNTNTFLEQTLMYGEKLSMHLMFIADHNGLKII